MPGSRTFDKSMIPKIRQLIVTGVAMITGSVPPSTIVACLHLLIHYADHTQLFGILKWYWMMTFERYNRFVKKMCHNTHWPLALGAAAGACAAWPTWCGAHTPVPSPRRRCAPHD